MNITQAQYQDFEKSAGYICTLCGYPSVTPDKMKVLIGFLRDQFGNSTLEQFEEAFTSLAAGKLDEKLESIKSLTGLTAARVMQSYQRSKMSRADSVQQPEVDRSFINDENRKLIYDQFNRWVKYNDELNDEERTYLMTHWIEKNRELFYQTGRTDNLTSTSFDFMMKNGTLRIHDNDFQRWTGKAYETICTWDEVVSAGRKLKRIEDVRLSGAYSTAMRKQKDRTYQPEIDTVKRQAVAMYFESVK